LKLAVLALAGAALYIAAGIFLAPRLIERQLVSFVETHSDLTLAIDRIAVNPINLTLSFENFTLLRPENTLAVSINRIEARLRPRASLTQRAWLFADTVVSQLRIDLGHGAYTVAAAELRSDPRLEFGPDGVRFEGDLGLASVGITESASAATVVTIGALSAEGVAADRSSSLLIDAVKLKAPRIRIRRGGDGSLGFPDEIVRLLFDPAPGRRMIAKVDIRGGKLAFTDEVVQPAAELDFDEIEASITQRRSGADVEVAVTARGRIGGGSGDFRAAWLPARPSATLDVRLLLREADLPPLSTYIEGAIGGDVERGVLDLEVEIEDGAAVDNRFSVQNLQIGAPAAPSLELAIALLEDVTGSMAFSLPLNGMPGIVSEPRQALSRSISKFVTRLAGAPFDYLAELAGAPGLELAQLAFPAGSAEIAGETAGKIAALERVLKLRPALGLAVHGSYDPAADRAVLAHQQIRLHVALAASTRPPAEATEEAMEFTDHVVRNVLDEFAAERLPAARQAAVRARFTEGDTRYYRALFEALVDNETVPRQALERLARFRAHTVIAALEAPGEDPARVVQADAVEALRLPAPGGPVVRLEARPLEYTIADPSKASPAME